MPLINAGPLLSIISSYRFVWICGRVGGHKTSLAYALAEPYLKQGYRLITNNKSVWADDYTKLTLDKDNHLKAVVLLDEGGLYFKASKQVEMIASYPAKMDLVFIFPSFWPPVRAAQIITVQPIFNFKSTGIPLVAYKWRVSVGSWQDKGNFFWYDPSSFYGIYSRQDPGDRAEGIIKYLIDQSGEYRKRYGRDNDDDLSEVGEPTALELLSDSSENMANAAEILSTVSQRTRRRGGWF